MIIYLALFIIIFYMFTFTESFRESYIKHFFRKLRYRINFDISYSLLTSIERLLSISIISFSILYIAGYTGSILLIGLLLTFPYVNNETYIMVRNKLDSNLFCGGRSSNISFFDRYERPILYLNCFWRRNLAFIGFILQILGMYLILF